MRAITWLNTLNRMYLRFPYDLRGILAKLVVSSNRHSELARREIIELRAANLKLEQERDQLKQENAKLMAELEALQFVAPVLPHGYFTASKSRTRPNT